MDRGAAAWVSVGVGVGVGDFEGLGDVERAAAGTTLCVSDGLGADAEVAVLPHPAARMATNASAINFREVMAGELSVTPFGQARTKGPGVADRFTVPVAIRGHTGNHERFVGVAAGLGEDPRRGLPGQGSAVLALRQASSDRGSLAGARCPRRPAHAGEPCPVLPAVQLKPRRGVRQPAAPAAPADGGAAPGDRYEAG